MITLFYRRLLASPSGVAAFAPSSRYLARAMTRDLSARTGPVVELGPGTGVITRAILARGVAPEKLWCLEIDPEFADALRGLFPGVNVVTGSATRLASVLPKALGRVGAVISGLPISRMGVAAQMRVLSGAMTRLAPGGAFYQISYLPVSPVPQGVIDRLGLTVERHHWAWLNLPPAFLWRYTPPRAESPRLKLAA